MDAARDSRWLLLIHQIPPKPDYFRVKIWRRLMRVGAVAVKNSVYVLPKSDSTLEDFQWILREITEGGGDASLCEADFVEGLTDSQIESLFRVARDADYAAVAEEARELTKRKHSRGSDSINELSAAVTKLRNRLTEIVTIDYFDSLGRQTAEGLVFSLERVVQPAPTDETVKSPSEYRGITWVTRKGI